MSKQKAYKTIRAVVECRVPENITEKDLVWHLKDILKWPLQLGRKGQHDTLVKPEFKQFNRVVTALRKREEGFWSRVRMGTHRDAD
jgi:hypothetical protein